jgi:hypothetical protein
MSEEIKKNTSQNRRVVAYLTPSYYNKYINFINKNEDRKCTAAKEIIEQFLDKREKPKF